MMAVSQRMAEHCITVYAALEELAEDGVFRGSVSKLYDSTGVSRAHYRKIWTLLTDLGCITREIETSLGIGSRKASVVRLNHRPTVEEFAGAYLTSGLHSDSVLLDSRLKTLERRLGEINVVNALAELTRQFKELEAEVGKIKASSSKSTTN